MEQLLNLESEWEGVVNSSAMKQRRENRWRYRYDKMELKATICLLITVLATFFGLFGWLVSWAAYPVAGIACSRFCFLLGRIAEGK